MDDSDLPPDFPATYQHLLVASSESDSDARNNILCFSIERAMTVRSVFTTTSVALCLNYHFEIVVMQVGVSIHLMLDCTLLKYRWGRQRRCPEYLSEQNECREGVLTVFI